MGNSFYYQSIVVCFHRHETHRSEYAEMVLSGERLEVLIYIYMMTRVIEGGKLAGARARCEQTPIKLCVALARYSKCLPHSPQHEVTKSISSPP